MATDPLRRNLLDAERRFLALQGRTAYGPTVEAFAEFQAILEDLRTIGSRLVEMTGRRDASFFVERRLAILHQHCLWLARRVSAECLLLHEIRLEQALRRLISLEAYHLYLRLEDVEDAAREVEMLDDRDLMARLREGTLVSGILEPVLEGDGQSVRDPSGDGPIR